MKIVVICIKYKIKRNIKIEIDSQSWMTIVVTQASIILIKTLIKNKKTNSNTPSNTNPHF
jgi:hypothetical protein